MRRYYSFLIFATALVAILGVSNISAAINVEKEIADSCKKGDYRTAVKLLEDHLLGLEQKVKSGSDVNKLGIIAKYIMLGHVLAWKVGNFDDAIMAYERAVFHSKNNSTTNQGPGMMSLFMAEVYEHRGKIVTAREHYERLLNELAQVRASEHTTQEMMMNNELSRFIKYQLDGLALKEKSRDTRKLLMPRVKLMPSPADVVILQMLALSCALTLPWDTELERQDAATVIQRAPADFSNMFLDLSLVLAASQSSISRDSERAMNAFMKKYPDSYYSLVIGATYYQHYKDSGQKEKAGKLLAELQRRAASRKIELVVTPEAKFVTPEATWNTFRKALENGDMAGIVECYAPGREKHGEELKKLGREFMKDLARTSSNIHKMQIDKQHAIYEIIRMENGKSFSYQLQFVNIGGEWKIEGF